MDKTDGKLKPWGATITPNNPVYISSGENTIIEPTLKW